MSEWAACDADGDFSLPFSPCLVDGRSVGSRLARERRGAAAAGA